MHPRAPSGPRGSMQGHATDAGRGGFVAAAFERPIPDSLEHGETGPCFPVEVFNVLGAGDGFM